MDLELIIAFATIVTALATLLTFLLSFGSRWADHPRPKFAIIPHTHRVDKTRPFNFPVAPTWKLQVSNVGTGDAHLASVIGVYCLARESNKDGPGHGINQTIIKKGEKLDIEIIPSILQWRQVGILITWSQPRVLAHGFKRCHWFLKLSKHYGQPVPVITRVDDLGEHHFIDPVNPTAPEYREQLLKADKRLEISGELAKVSSCWWRRYWQFRKLRRAGWEWLKALPKPK